MNYAEEKRAWDVMKLQRRVIRLLKHPEMKLFVVAVIFLAISWPVFNQDRLPLMTSFLLISGIWLFTVAMLFLMRRE